MFMRFIVSPVNICGLFSRLALSPVTRSSIRRMNKAYFRFVEGSEQYQLCLNIKDESLGVDRQFNFNRKASENIGTLIARINTNLGKEVEKIEKKRKKKLKKTNLEEGERTEGNPSKITCELLSDSTPVSHDSICQDILLSQSKLSIQICDIEYQVVLNSPWIDAITLPTTIMAGFQTYPVKFSAVFTDKSKSLFAWYSGKVNDQDWRKVCDGYYYKPSTDDIGNLLKFTCIPVNDETQGPMFDVISKNPIEAGPGYCPFETRHLFTSHRLDWPNFRVMSYNILADLYADSDVARNQLYPYCPAYALGIDYRKQLLLKEIVGYKADVICLQEVDKKVFFNDLVPFLTDFRYEGVFSKKGGEVAEGVACFYHQSKFRLMNSYNICLAEELSTNPVFSELWEKLKDNTNLVSRFNDRTTCLMVVLLQSTVDPNEVFLVGNTHLYFHPNADHIRLLQAGMIVQYIEHLKAELHLSMPDARISVIMCGDFNSTPDCGVYQLMTTQWVPDDFKDWKSKAEEAIENVSLSHTMLLQSACGTPELTNYTVGFVGCLDYIFYQTDNLAVCQVVPFPSEEELKQHTALPSVVFPSDHVALISDLQLIKEGT